VLCALAVAVTALTEKEYQTKFMKYQTKFNKNYQSPAQIFARYNAFKANYDVVQKHNTEAKTGKHSFTLAMNQFGDLTNAEYRRTVLGLRRSQPASTGAAATYEADPSVTAPASVDWRTHSPAVVTPVKDQGQCGSCWAFSAVGAMEGAHALATSNLIAFSEQELVDCVNGGADNCTAGGEMHDGYLYAISAGGMETESDYPYSGTSGNKCGFDKTKSVATFSSYMNVTSGDETALAQAVSDYPTISVGIDASSIWFQLYSTGVYDDSSCKSDWNDLDHGVLVVGYGADAASGKNYWIVKNSWNSIWGQQGYIWMVKDKSNQCGISTDATFPLV